MLNPVNNLQYKGTMKIGGINTSVLRELSGLYQPFEKAVKELVVNSMDAGSTNVSISITKDYDVVKVLDNGCGMTLFDFKNSFLYIGKLKENSADLHLRVGGKGIGFLAPARYCKKMLVKSTTKKKVSIYRTKKITNHKINLLELVGEPILPESLLLKYLSVVNIKYNNKDMVLGVDYFVERGYLVLNNQYKKIDIILMIDFSSLVLEAVIDFDYLFSDDVKESLEEIEDFCTINVTENLNEKNKNYTQIELIGIKNFLKETLRQPRKKGNVRNVSSMKGIDQFVWNLANSIPVKFEESSNLPDEVSRMLSSRKNVIEEVMLKIGDLEQKKLRKPIYEPPSKMNDKDKDLWEVIKINEGDFLAEGYIMGQQNIIYPAELRGLSIKVKNVEIGLPSFLGLENTLTGAKKAALNQITGEINIIKGMDAIEEITPGRDGFYTESKGYQILIKHLLGEDGQSGGIFGKIISAIVNRSQMRSSVKNMIQKASGIRESLLKASYAINSYINEHPEIIQVFTTPDDNLQLRDKEDYELGPEQMLKSFRIIQADNLDTTYKLDYMNKTITIDKYNDIWNREIFVMGQYFKIKFKKGKGLSKLCEIDAMKKEVLINWDHPTRSLLGDRYFIRNAISWAVALASSPGDPDQMITSALHLTTINI